MGRPRPEVSPQIINNPKKFRIIQAKLKSLFILSPISSAADKSFQKEVFHPIGLNPILATSWPDHPDPTFSQNYFLSKKIRNQKKPSKRTDGPKVYVLALQKNV